MTTAEFFAKIGPAFCPPDYEVYFKLGDCNYVRFVWIGIGVVDCLTVCGRIFSALPGGVK